MARSVAPPVTRPSNHILLSLWWPIPNPGGIPETIDFAIEPLSPGSPTLGFSVTKAPKRRVSPFAVFGAPRYLTARHSEL